MARKKVRFNRSGIDKLPDDKPVVYRIKTDGGTDNYVGVAKKGRVQDRLDEHLKGTDYVPGASIEIEQMNSISDARAKEARVISRSKPKYNEQGK